MSDLLSQLDRATLEAIAGHVPSKKAARQAIIISESASILPVLMRQFEISTELRIEHFLAQIAHESDSFCTTREYASGAAYEGRADLGNTEKGDGVRYSGRGLIQNTGRANARSFTRWMRGFMRDAPNFETDPELMEEFPWAAWSAVWFWSIKSLNAVADRDDLIRVTKVVNGGRNGLDDRERRLAIARRKIEVKAVITPIAADLVSKAQDGFPVLFRGVQNRVEQVDELQQALKHLGHYHLSIDGDFGPGTEQAVRSFQAKHGLRNDGIVGRRTWTALLQASGTDA